MSRFRDRMLRLRASEDDGAILLLALLFVGATALLITGVLEVTTTSVSKAAVTRELAAKRYAADAGVKYGIQQLRSNTEACDDGVLAAPPELLGDAYSNLVRPTLTVTCTVTNRAEILGAAGYALITRDTSTDGLGISAANASLTVGGPVYISSQPTALPFTVTGGNVWYLDTDGSCPSRPSDLVTQTPPYTFACHPGPVPDPAPTLPDAVPADRAATPEAADILTLTNCAIFNPGTYRSVKDPITGAVLVNGILLDAYDNIFFRSGVYYFEDTDIVLTKQALFGGDPATYNDPLIPDEKQESNSARTACATSYGAGPQPADRGVKIILGGSSRLVADNPGGHVELYSRFQGAASEGTQGVSIMTVPATGATVGINDPTKFKPSTSNFGELRVGVINSGSSGGGQTLSMAVHGLTYVPDGLVAIRNTQSESKFMGGLVAGRLEISTSSQVGGFALSAPSRNVPRKMRLEAIATGNGANDAPVRAVVDLEVNDTTKVATVKSWFSGQ